MKILDGLKYSREHEWVKIEGNRAYIGITDYAQDSLGDIVFVDLPETGTSLEAGDVLCTVESVKAASDVYSPVAGKVVEVNEALSDDPSLLNQDPYGNWIAVLEISDTNAADSLMDASDYKAFCAGEE
jgi:glycine cleavage system H protein